MPLPGALPYPLDFSPIVLEILEVGNVEVIDPSIDFQNLQVNLSILEVGNVEVIDGDFEIITTPTYASINYARRDAFLVYEERKRTMLYDSRDTLLSYDVRRDSIMSSRWAKESPVDQVINESIPYVLEIDGASTISSPTVKAYQAQSEITSNVFPSGSPSVSGNTITLPNAVANTDDDETPIVVVCTATVDGATEKFKLQINLSPEGAEQ